MRIKVEADIVVCGQRPKKILRHARHMPLPCFSKCCDHITIYIVSIIYPRRIGICGHELHLELGDLLYLSESL